MIYGVAEGRTAKSLEVFYIATHITKNSSLLFVLQYRIIILAQEATKGHLPGCRQQSLLQTILSPTELRFPNRTCVYVVWELWALLP